MVRFTEKDALMLADRMGRGQDITTKKKGKRVKRLISNISCHALALARLMKNPELRHGGIINGKRLQANHEHWDQVQIFDYFERTNPEVYDHLAAVPNGGKRPKKTAQEMYEEGAKAGYPDMILDLPRGNYHGMRIELKHENGGPPSDNQKKMLNRLHQQRYFVVLVYGFSEAIRVIEQYVLLPAGADMPEQKTQIKWLSDDRNH